MRPFVTFGGPRTLAHALAGVCVLLAVTLADAAPARRAMKLPSLAPAPQEIQAQRLGRAALEHSTGNLRGVVENLEPIDFSVEPSFPEADRAAFLLGQAYLRLGSVDRFADLARQVGRWKSRSVYTRWLAFQLLMAENQGVRPEADDDTSSTDGNTPRFDRGHDLGVGPAADALAAAVLMRSGNAEAAQRLVERLEDRKHPDPLVIYFKALSLAATLREDEPEWTRLAKTDTSTNLGRDLVGAAIIRLATYALARGDDPRPLLLRMPAGSRFQTRALHMRGLAALERGEDAEGTQLLHAVLAADTSYSDRREVLRALGARDLDHGRWEDAHATYGQIDQDWSANRQGLERWIEDQDYEALWSAWESNTPFSDAVHLDALPARLLAEQLGATAADLSTRPDYKIPDLQTTPQLPAPRRWPVAPPPAGDWNRVSAAERRVGEARHDLARTRWALADEQARLENLRRYLGVGEVKTARAATELAARAAFLDSLRASLDSLDARLRGARDRATRHVLSRLQRILQDCADDLLWLGGMRHFHLEGPNRDRAVPPPPGHPSADSLVRAEEMLARAVTRMAEGMAADAPALIARSYEQAWRPGLVERVRAQSDEAHRQLAWAQALAATIDSARIAAATSEEVRRLEAAIVALELRADSLQTAYHAERAATARAAVERAIAALDDEREGIDYGLAVAAYAACVHLAPPDSTYGPEPGPGVPRAAMTADESGADATETPEAAERRRQAIAALRTFLERHPETATRGEIRFRLADLLLVDAQQDFRARMARYLDEQSRGGAPGPLPVLSHEPALDLYRKILAQDRTFLHRDAAMFNAAMILADEGNPEAERFFDDLVTEYSNSPYVQESYLRMGDMHFNEKGYADAVKLYQKAVAGPDPGLKAIALYKMGWAHYNEDRFAEAADAFRGVLDLYVDQRPRIQADIEGEAQAYLVHSLAGAGGAPAFAAYFDSVGSRPYEMRVLMAMGQEMRRQGRFAEAVETDELCITRYAQHPDALLSAQRLIETEQRAERSDQVSAARLAQAPRFAPGSAWYQAQTSDSVRAAASKFAHDAWLTEAREHHLEARKDSSSANWRAALEQYENVIQRFPGDPEAPELRMAAGEAATKLGDYPTALRHYGAAAAGNDSIAADALWQKVAVSDAWYQSTRKADAGAGATGDEARARAVVTAADTLLERFPQHPKSADLMWRQGNLDFAHGWYDRAARDLGRLAATHPGDARAPRAAILRADALFQTAAYESAGVAYESALEIARAAKVDSLAKRAAQAIPIAHYRHAEAAVAADSTAPGNAELFEKIATRWPEFEQADVAQYRAGLAYQKSRRGPEAVRAFESLITKFPRSSYVRDAHLQIARAWETQGDSVKAGDAYGRFADTFPDDASAKDAWLRSADLYAGAGQEKKAEERRLAYIKRYPDDIPTAMEILEGLARRDLATVKPGHPISTLLPAPPPTATPAAAKGKKGTKSAKTAKAKAAPAAPEPPRSHLAEYLRRAEQHPDLASRDLIAQVRFLQGEEAYERYDAGALRLPLDKSIPERQKRLDEVMTRYKGSAEAGVSSWAHASAFRIGQALVAFGEALERSERPADLQGDDLKAYEEVLLDRSQAFYDRGEGVWADLLKDKKGEAATDPWIGQTQTALWKRLGNRFFYRPEVDFPQVAATPAAKVKVDKKRSERAGREGADSAAIQAQLPQEGSQP